MEMQRWKDCGAVFAEDFGRTNDDLTYIGTTIVGTPYGDGRQVDTSDGIAINKEIDLGDFTIAVHIKITDAIASTSYFTYGSADSVATYIRFANTSTINTQVKTTSSFVYTTHNLSNPIPTNEWITLVFTRETSSFKMYMNGTHEYTGGVSNLGFLRISDLFGNSGSSVFENICKDLIIEDRAWSQEEVTAYHENSSFDYEKNIVSRWNLDNVDLIEDTGVLKNPRVTTDGSDDYIDTGIVPTENTEFTIYGNFNSLPATFQMHGTYYGRMEIGTSSSGANWSYSFGNDTNNSFGSSDTLPHKFTLNKTGYYIDDVKVQTPSYTSFDATGHTIHIGAKTTSGPTQFCDFTLEYAKISENGVLVRDFIPIEKGQSIRGVTASANGLFDKVTNTVYTNGGTGDLEYADGANMEIDSTYCTTVNSPWGTAIDFPRNYGTLWGNSMAWTDRQSSLRVDDFTLITHINPQHIISYSSIMSIEGSTGTYTGMVFRQNASSQMEVLLGTTGGVKVITVAKDVVIDEWMQVVIIKNGLNLKVYFNGETSPTTNTTYTGDPTLTWNANSQTIFSGAGNVFDTTVGNKGKYQIGNTYFLNKPLEFNEMQDMLNRINRGEI